jgi:hypothetical protein
MGTLLKDAVFVTIKALSGYFPEMDERKLWKPLNQLVFEERFETDLLIQKGSDLDGRRCLAAY